ncbi:MAG: hypothetical protein Kow00107_05810 [Planctomycetota bacterium]
MAKISGQLRDYSCRNHPNRTAVGVCRSCGKLVCEDCMTMIEGVITCTSCVKRNIARERGNVLMWVLRNPLISFIFTLISLACITWFCYYVSVIFLDIDDLFRNMRGFNF